MIEVRIEKRETASIAYVIGEIDAAAAPEVQEKVLRIAVEGAVIVIDMTKTEYMSSAGLRMLLSVYRQATAHKAKISLVGVSEDIQDTMSMTGFSGFFTIHETIDAALQA